VQQAIRNHHQCGFARFVIVAGCQEASSDVALLFIVSDVALCADGEMIG
jgi:hypothetical protein